MLSCIREREQLILMMAFLFFIVADVSIRSRLLFFAAHPQMGAPCPGDLSVVDCGGIMP